MTRVAVKPALLRWARERAGFFDIDELAKAVPKLRDWEAGTIKPTLRQLEAFARRVHVPIGYLFLSEPPVEPLPIPDFRTLDGEGVRRPSPELLDMVYACQERQAWFREYAIASQMAELDFVRSASIDQSPIEVAAVMAERLGFKVAERAACGTWEEALRRFISQAEAAGILVMVSSIVLSNTHRPLDPQEFRGFALVDTHAPLVFINGADSKSAQMFTLAHEVAHIWLGASAVSDLSVAPGKGQRREEVWCNAVAAELLAPLKAVRAAVRPGEPLEQTVTRLTRQFKVSTLVILRRLLDSGIISREAFDAAWEIERDRLRLLAARMGGGGGDFYRTTLSRVGRRFAYAVVESTREGQTLYRDAFRMLGVNKTETFNTIGRQLGAIM